MTVAHILAEKGGEVTYIGENETVGEACGVLKQHGIGAVIVMEKDGSIDGVLSERDIVRALADNGADLLSKPVSSLMTRNVFTCTPTDSIASVMALMTAKRIRHVPVVADGRLVGLVSIGDVVRHRIAEKELEAAMLVEYITTG